MGAALEVLEKRGGQLLGGGEQGNDDAQCHRPITGAIESKNIERHRHFVGEQGHDQRVVMEFRHCICCRCGIHWFRCRRVAFRHWRHFPLRWG